MLLHWNMRQLQVVLLPASGKQESGTCDHVNELRWGPFIGSWFARSAGRELSAAGGRGKIIFFFLLTGEFVPFRAFSRPGAWQPKKSPDVRSTCLLAEPTERAKQPPSSPQMPFWHLLFFSFWLAIARQNLFYTFSVVINLFFQSTFIFCLAEFASAGRCGMILLPNRIPLSLWCVSGWFCLYWIDFIFSNGLLPVSIHLTPIADHGHRSLDL